jgi:hypothetical protein
MNKPKRSSKPKKRKELKFEYCECGCHSHVAEFGRECFGIFNSLKRVVRPYTLSNGHIPYMSQEYGKYKSFSEAQKAATKIARTILTKMKRQLG